MLFVLQLRKENSTRCCLIEIQALACFFLVASVQLCMMASYYDELAHSLMQTGHCDMAFAEQWGFWWPKCRLCGAWADELHMASDRHKHRVQIHMCSGGKAMGDGGPFGNPPGLGKNVDTGGASASNDQNKGGTFA